jgi:predicted ArsR family transcriptional regulator
MVAVEMSREAQISAIAALDEPTRHRLYDYVVRQPHPVGRDEVAAALALPRTTAAFHLDRLVDEHLLEVIYQRRTGRTGPGAGRPAKLYRRSPQHIVVSLPPRRYDLAGRLLSAAVAQADRSGHSPRALLDQRAHELGKELGVMAPATASGCHTRDSAVGVLQAQGYEPRTEHSAIILTNCPFHALAQHHPQLVCGRTGSYSVDFSAAWAPPGSPRCCVPAPAAAVCAWNRPRHQTPLPHRLI